MTLEWSTIADSILTPSSLITEIATAKTTLRGGIPESQITSGSLEKRHLARMRHIGSPAKVSSSGLTMVAYNNTGPDDPDVRKKRHRAILHRQFVRGDQSDLPVPGLCRTIRLPARAYVTVAAWLSADEMRYAADTTGLTEATYPPTSLNDAWAGSVVAKMRAHSDGTVTTDDASRAQVCVVSDIRHSWRCMQVLGVFTASAAGVYDFYVAYETDNAYNTAGADELAEQVIVGNRGIVVRPKFY